MTENKISQIPKEENSELFYSSLSFKELNLTEDTLSSLSDNNFKTATIVQSKVIPIAKKGKDILCTAKTGSGKTLAFLIPAMEILVKTNFQQNQGVGIIIITPTRELAIQIYDIAKELLFKIHKTCGLIIGGGYRKKEAAKLVKGVNLLIATPGRLLDHIKATEGFKYDNLCLLIMDEADMILKNGFEDELKEILNYLPKERQTMLFSATLNKNVENLNLMSMNKPVYINIINSLNSNIDNSPSIKNLDQGFIIVPPENKFQFLYTFLKKFLKQKIMVFFNTCAEVNFYSYLLNYIDIKVLSITGELKQANREIIYRQFFNEKNAILLCTDIAQRGLDFPDVDWIINYDLPLSADEYIHRVGRTARGPDSNGKSILILLENEKDILSRLKEKKIVLKEYIFKEKKLDNIQEKFEMLIEGNPALENLAEEAFKHYVYSYMYSKVNDKDNKLNIEKLNKDKLIRSFGLKKVPFLKIKTINKK